MGSKKVSWVVWAIVLLGVLVILLPFLCLLKVYKMFANICLGGRILKGLDAVWALDTDTSTSLTVINMLAIITGDITIEKIKQVIKEKSDLEETHKKMTRLRMCSFFGYCYWKKQENYNLDDYVRQLDCVKGNELVSEEDLRNILSNLCNTKLPHGHLAGWEICLGPKILLHQREHRAIIFRMHHSLADGPAIVRSLLTHLATKEDQHLLTPDPDVIKRFTTRIQARKNAHFMDSVVDFGRIIKAEYFLPPDMNLFHGPKLSGKSQLAWCGSSELMLAAKKIRSQTGATFTAGLVASFLAAVSQYGEYADTINTFSIVLPSRVPSKKMEATAEMTNSFTMTAVKRYLPKEDEDVFSQVMSMDKALIRATEPGVLVCNGFIMNLMGDLCPRSLLSAAFHSRQCTAFLGNMPGPQEKISLFGSPLEKLAFWAPNKDTTGVTANIVSYAGELTLGLNIDSALLKEHDGAQKLANIWGKQLVRMAEQLSM